jgi:ActR/RegA family two-component response regulator
MSSSPRILLVMSDSQLAATLGSALSTVDAALDSHRGTSEALAAAQSQTPRAAFVYAASRGEGLNTFVTSLRRVPGCERLPICVIGPSAVADEARANECQYLPNPVSLVSLVRLARELLSQ